MSSSLVCRNCGAVVPSDAPLGICPRCLLQAGLEPSCVSGGGAPATAALDPTDRRQEPFLPPTVEKLQRLFPQLEILELLGKGGMGAVYKARQPGLDRLAALKILPPQFGRDEAFAERFKREARALARLGHPNIVAVYDFGQTGDLCWFLMEYVDGADLRHAMRAGSLSAQEALAVVPQICDALQYAHDEGIVHRDVKPENVLLDRRGRVKIADFGLAKLLGGETPVASITLARQVMGTPRYMAPEQMEGSEQVDHRADIYSLGVVFYELLTGEIPAGRFLPPSQKVHVDVRLDEVVLRSLEREPDKRWQQASQVKSQVDRIVSESAPARRTERNAKPASFDAVEAPTSSLTTAWVAVIAVINLLSALLLMFLLAGDPESSWIPESAGPWWRNWEAISTYLTYAIYGMTLLAAVGMLMRQPWARTLTIGTCWASLAMVVTDTPYISRFYVSNTYDMVHSELIAEGSSLDEAQLVAFALAFFVFGVFVPIGFAWLLFQIVYLSRRSVVRHFEGATGHRAGPFSRALVWLPAVVLLGVGGAAYAILLAFGVAI